MIRISFFLGVLLFFSLPGFGQVILQDEPIPLKPSGFYIARVTDERPIKRSLLGEDLQGGGAIALFKYLSRNLPQDKTKRPVSIKIKALTSTESGNTAEMVNGKLQLHFSFGLEKNYGFEHLVDYRGGLTYKRNQANKIGLERYVRSLTTAALVYFNNWVKDNEPVNRKLATSVKFNFTDFEEQPEGDTIYYSAKRPLTFRDFQSRNRPRGNFGAVVFPGIGYEQQAEMVNGIIEVDISIKAFLPKSAAWVAETNKDPYTLNHEQRHFDIAKIVAEQFKEKVLAAGLTPDTFEGFLTMQYLDTLRDLDAMQKAYDKETGHGMNRIAQSMWNTKIDELLP